MSRLGFFRATGRDFVNEGDGFYNRFHILHFGMSVSLLQSEKGHLRRHLPFVMAFAMVFAVYDGICDGICEGICDGICDAQ